MKAPQLNACKTFPGQLQRMDFYNSGHILSASSGVDEFDIHRRVFHYLRTSNFHPSFSFSLPPSLTFSLTFFHM